MSVEYVKPVPPPGEGENRVPQLAKVPNHVGIIMDGNGRWANARGLTRTAGHQAGEVALMDTLAGAVEAGVKNVTVYAFSTENWKRSPAEVRFLMGYSRDVLRRRRDELHSWGVRVQWWGRRARLWKSVISELETARELTAGNQKMNFTMAINYGGRAEIVDAARSLAAQAAAGKISAQSISERSFSAHLYGPKSPDVDLLIRTGGEQRISNFLLWQCAYAEFAFNPLPWPEYNREALWDDLLVFGGRERRFGAAVDKVAGS
ncbi:MAG: polyprenyl diphosphate synthase [Actinomycetaceae bacterium]|nr:polyprenyl diphosphate synthase [Actinomycetaceae bacterium]